MKIVENNGKKNCKYIDKFDVKNRKKIIFLIKRIMWHPMNFIFLIWTICEPKHIYYLKKKRTHTENRYKIEITNWQILVTCFFKN